MSKDKNGNVKLIFGGTKHSETKTSSIEILENNVSEIIVAIKKTPEGKPFWISLDKSTAVRFQRELKKQISFLNE